MKRLVKSVAVLFLLTVMVPPVTQAFAADPGCTLAHAVDGADAAAVCHRSADHGQHPCADCCAGVCAAALRADTHGLSVLLSTTPRPTFTTWREDAPATVDTRPPI